MHFGLKIVTSDWVTDSIKKEEKLDETIYHPELVEYPKPQPPTPPPPEVPPPEPMEVEPPPVPAPVASPVKTPPKSTRPSWPLVTGGPPLNQNQVNYTHRSAYDPRGQTSGGVGPTSPNAKQALARMVNSRIQVCLPELLCLHKACILLIVVDLHVMKTEYLESLCKWLKLSACGLFSKMNAKFILILSYIMICYFIGYFCPIIICCSFCTTFLLYYYLLFQCRHILCCVFAVWSNFSIFDWCMLM